MVFQITACFVTTTDFDYIVTNPTGEEQSDFFEQIAKKNWLRFDGVTFGPEDTAAVKDTQRRASLEPNGVVDRPTWAALRAQSHTACDNCTEEG